MFEYIWILLPIGLLIGWFAAKKDIAKKQRILHYLNLRYLLEDQTQKDYENLALEMPLDSDVEALKFSLLLGDAFRKRGEIDKAINLHETLIRQAQTPDLRASAYLSLAKDYLSAGILNHAEETLRLVVDGEFEAGHKNKALIKLAHLYKQQRDWLQSLSMLEKISDKDPLILEEMAHLYCELAEEDLAKDLKGERERIFVWLTKALECDENCARVSLITAFIYLKEKNYAAALEALLHIEKQKHALVPITAPMICDLAFRLERPHFFIHWLDRLLAESDRHFILVLWKAHYLVRSESIHEAIDYLKSVLSAENNLRGLLLLNELLSYAETSNESLVIYKKTLNSVIDRYSNFQCENCGFTSKTLHWNCPSCNHWNTSAPVSDIIALKH